MSKCTATTKKGTRCTIEAGPSGLCHVHDPKGTYAQQHPGYAARIGSGSPVAGAAGAGAAPRASSPARSRTARAQVPSRFDLSDLATIPAGYDVVAYTDGACSPNPGPGGWGVALVTSHTSVRDLSGGSAFTTNQEMELTAALTALEVMAPQTRVLLVSDSQWVIRGVTENWVRSWRSRGWVTSSRDPVKHRALWERLEQANQGCVVTWHWVKGHSGVPGNERADRLAVAGRTDLRSAPALPPDRLRAASPAQAQLAFDLLAE